MVARKVLVRYQVCILGPFSRVLERRISHHPFQAGRDRAKAKLSVSLPEVGCASSPDMPLAYRAAVALKELNRYGFGLYQGSRNRSLNRKLTQ